MISTSPSHLAVFKQLIQLTLSKEDYPSSFRRNVEVTRPAPRLNCQGIPWERLKASNGPEYRLFVTTHRVNGSDWIHWSALGLSLDQPGLIASQKTSKSKWPFPALTYSTPFCQLLYGKCCGWHPIGTDEVLFYFWIQIVFACNILTNPLLQLCSLSFILYWSLFSLCTPSILWHPFKPHSFSIHWTHLSHWLSPLLSCPILIQLSL